MALKDWKKSIRSGFYTHKSHRWDKEKYLNYGFNGSNYYVILVDGSKAKQKEFKTKTEALKFVKAYMRIN